MKKHFAAMILYSFISLLLITSAKAAESITIYVDDGNADYLVEVIVTGEKDAGNLVMLLEEHQMVPEGTKVNSFEIVQAHKKEVGKLDLSSEFGKAVTETGTAGETMYIYSVVNTMITNFKLDEIFLTVDGEVISTGHTIYDTSLSFYDHIIKAVDWNVKDICRLNSVGDVLKVGRMRNAIAILYD